MKILHNNIQALGQQEYKSKIMDFTFIIAVKRRDMKSKEEKERYKHLNAVPEKSKKR